MWYYSYLKNSTCVSVKNLSSTRTIFCIVISQLKWLYAKDYSSGIMILISTSKTLPYVRHNFVWGQAVGIFYIPWPAKKIAAQTLTQLWPPILAQNWAAHTANRPKLPKMNFKKTNIRSLETQSALYFYYISLWALVVNGTPNLVPLSPTHPHKHVNWWKAYVCLSRSGIINNTWDIFNLRE